MKKIYIAPEVDFCECEIDETICGSVYEDDEKDLNVQIYDDDGDPKYEEEPGSGWEIL